MKELYLEAYDLIKICVFNGLNESYYFSKQTKAEQLQTFENKLLKYISKNSPNLEPNVNVFKDSYLRIEEIKSEDGSKITPMRLFVNSFEGKIKLKNFIEPLLSPQSYNQDDSDKIKFYKHIYEKEPSFFIIMHNYLHETVSKNHHIISHCLYDTYFQLMKNKKNLQFEHLISKKEIFTIVDSFVTHDPEYIKKHINAYLHILPKDSNTFHLIFNKYQEYLENNADIKIHFESKLKHFPSSVISIYESQKKEIPWGEDEELYLYNFKVNNQYAIEKTQLSPTKNNYFLNTLHNSVTKFLESKFNAKSLLTYGGQKVSVSFSSLEDKTKAIKFMDLMKTKLEEVVLNYFKKDKHYGDIYEELSNYFEKLNLVFELDSSLSNKQSETKQIKRKI